MLIQNAIKDQNKRQLSGARQQTMIITADWFGCVIVIIAAFMQVAYVTHSVAEEMLLVKKRSGARVELFPAQPSE